MSIRITKVGTLATIQDGGRWGYQDQGVPICGAMDDESLINANLLVGNKRDDACIEIASGKFEVTFTEDCLIAITGNGTHAKCDGHVIPFNKQVHVKGGAVLAFSPSNIGYWTYLSIAGGLVIPVVLDSYSTYLPAHFGGVEGRPLKVGDELNLNPASKVQSADFQIFRCSTWGIAINDDNSPIRVFQGPEWARLTDSSQRSFLDSDFKISADSNRMGYRLSGQFLKSTDKSELISTPVTKGTIQLTNDGSLIALMADAQTIGGYPRIGQVTAVDLARLAQKRPGESVRFQLISYDEACSLFLKREQERRKIEASIALKLKSL